ncbi:unnamed protein product [Urochloa decumbens]|uniref:Uncharacterized protein n=1 Tax=Urochloa decumbens TaxID=240449 RepID=A0ABC8ZH08_9POAL
MSTFQFDGNNNNATTIDINTSELFVEDATEIGASTRLARSLFLLGFVTLLMDITTALYKPPRGVIFQGHKLAYYLTLAGIFVTGLTDIWTGIWLSSSSQQNGCLPVLARALLYASVVPFVVIVVLGGFSVMNI